MNKSLCYSKEHPQECGQGLNSKQFIPVTLNICGWEIIGLCILKIPSNNPWGWFPINQINPQEPLLLVNYVYMVFLKTYWVAWFFFYHSRFLVNKKWLQFIFKTYLLIQECAIEQAEERKSLKWKLLALPLLQCFWQMKLKLHLHAKGTVAIPLIIYNCLLVVLLQWKYLRYTYSGGQ